MNRRRGKAVPPKLLANLDPGEESDVVPASWLSGEDIVCLALRRWHSPFKNNQQIMSLLSKSNRVLYIEPPMPLRDVINGFLRGECRPPLLETVTPTLYVYHGPGVFARPRRGQWLRVAAERLRLAHARVAARRLGFKAPILWIYDPMLSHVIGTFREKLVVYHVIDNYDEYFPRNLRSLRTAIIANQDRMLRAADVVFAVSRSLFERCSVRNPNTYLVPNGVNYRLFARAVADPWKPDDLAALRRPIVGYVGVIQSRLDFHLLREVATYCPDFSFALVGPKECLSADDLVELRRLLAKPNVHYLGSRPPAQIAHYMKICDVLLMPYRIDELTTHSDNLKLYEYLACGNPVVSTDILSVQRFRELVRVARDPRAFAYEIRQALEEGGRLKEVRMRVASEHSWVDRIDVMSRVLLSKLRAGADHRCTARRKAIPDNQGGFSDLGRRVRGQ